MNMRKDMFIEKKQAASYFNGLFRFLKKKGGR